MRWWLVKSPPLGKPKIGGCDEARNRRQYMRTTRQNYDVSGAVLAGRGLLTALRKRGRRSCFMAIATMLGVESEVLYFAHTWQAWQGLP